MIRKLMKLWVLVFAVEVIYLCLEISLSLLGVSGLSRNYLVVLLGILSLSTFVAGSVEEYKDAYEQLISYGFPRGILPDSVTGYSLEDDGHFSVYLEGKCNVFIPGEFPVIYSKTITGKLSFGSLTDLKGIQVQAYFFWWPIDTISVSNGNLVFEVGSLTAKYPVNNFDESPACEKNSMVDLILTDE
ncbi:hypothetical protein R1sor_017548 [Riccia sorocarpa]|uniref:DUF538 domain-containing protein n=1 Tax=Riccia sorocarpa TaxID=122646 RepID=A0ABD3I889_9MARC